MNGFLKQNGVNGVVVPAHVHPQELADVLKGLRSIQNLAGIIVTVPHKIAIMQLCDVLEDSALIAGAVNVIRRTPEGMLVGANYDGAGFVQSVRDRIGGVEGKSVYMLGAGGVARAIAFAFASAGVGRLAIHNRTEDKAAELAGAVQQHCPAVEVSLAGTRPEGFDVALNASTVGMGAGDAPPFSLDGLSRDCLVADVIMQPLITPLLAEAQRRGNPVCTGNGMLEHQLAAFSKFLGFLPLDSAAADASLKDLE
jgi:shikimate dehydrogenase